GGFDTTHNGNHDAFIAKINANTGTLLWSTYLGGSDNDDGRAITVDADGNAWVTGSTHSAGWTTNGFDTTYNGDGDAWVTKINGNGTLAWSSYLGGEGWDYGLGVAIDAAGNAWVVGGTDEGGWASGGFDTTYDGGENDGFLAKINADGTLDWTSYFGGALADGASSIAIDAFG